MHNITRPDHVFIRELASCEIIES